MSRQEKHLYEFGPFRLDPGDHLLLRAGNPVPLTPKAFETLVLLVRRRGHLVAKDELIKELWPDSFVEEANLSVNISALRKALGESPNEHQYIETVPKRGYRFVGGVKELRDESADLVVEGNTRARIALEEAEEASNQGGIETDHEPAVRSSEAAARYPTSRVEHLVGGIKHYQWSVVLTLAALMIGLAAIIYFTRGGETIDSVAVLPFVNASGDPDMEYLSDGISDSIMNSLSQLPNLKVMSLSSVLRYKGRQTDPQAVGRELNVRAVLIGRLMQRGDGLSISTELVDVRDNRRLWGGQYNRKLADILQLQGEISREISEKLRLKLSGEERKELAKRYTENTEAYQVYLQGRHYSQTKTEAGIKKGVEYFEQAIKIDPSYAPAYVGVARAYYSSRENFVQLPEEARQKIESALLKALELDGTLAEAHALLGAIRQDQGDWPAAEKELKRAINLNLNPNASVHWFYARYLTAIGRNDEAVAEAKRWLEVDPFSPSALATVGFMSLHARQYDQAIELFRKAVETEPEHPSYHTNLARAYAQKGMYEEAIAEFQKAMAINSSAPGRIAALAYTFAISGKRAEAQNMLAQLNQRAKHELVAPVYFAIIYTGLGEKDQAFEWLEKAYKDRSGPPYLAIDLMLDSLRSDPRFADLARRKGLAL